jgi:hypothetical protein
MYELILAIALVRTIGAVQLPLAFATAPPQGGHPHGFKGAAGQQLNPSTGDPHSSFAPQGDPPLCIHHAVVEHC